MAKKPAEPESQPLDPNLPDAPTAVMEPAQAPPAQAVDIPNDLASVNAIPKPAAVEEMKLPLDPGGYVVMGGRGLFSLTRLFLLDYQGNKRELCVPVNLQKENWPLERTADGQLLERCVKAQREDYSERDRDFILSLQRRPNWSQMEINGQPQAGRAYGFGGFDPLAAGDRAGAMPSTAVRNMDLALNGPLK